MDKLNIIGINGQLGSGKDTVADCFVNEGYVKISLADGMKRFCEKVFEFSDKQLFGPSNYRNSVDSRYFDGSQQWSIAEKNITDVGLVWVRELLPGKTPAETVEVYEALLHWFNDLRVKYPDLSPRIALQTVGTEWGRDAVDRDVWINYMYTVVKKLVHADGKLDVHYDYTNRKGLFPVEVSRDYIGVVVPDVRYKNELDFLLTHRCKTIRVVRPETDHAAEATGVTSHPSETEQRDFDLALFSAVLNNDSTIDKLQENTAILARIYAEN